MISQGHVRSIHRNAVTKGFWATLESLDQARAEGNIDAADYEARAFEFYAKQCMMIVSEATELMESLRKKKGIKETEGEAADIFIRLADLYEGLRHHGLVDDILADVVERKIEVNAARPQRHGVLG
jgi:hypothetical protein